MMAFKENALISPEPTKSPLDSDLSPIIENFLHHKVSNPIILDMLRTNEYMKNNIKQAIVEVTGERYGLGPYRPPEEKKADDADPLEKLIAALPKSPDIVIE